MRSGLIKHQHLYVKLGIFVIGLAAGFEVSLRQLTAQSFLFLIFMALDHTLYFKLFFALKKMISFMAAYWIFATIFAVDYMVTLRFSLQLCYFILIMVFVLGEMDAKALVSQCLLCKYSPKASKMLSFIMASYLFMQEYIKAFSIVKGDNGNLRDILQGAIQTGKDEHAKQSEIAARINCCITAGVSISPQAKWANLIGLLFLSCLGLVYSL